MPTLPGIPVEVSDSLWEVVHVDLGGEQERVRPRELDLLRLSEAVKPGNPPIQVTHAGASASWSESIDAGCGSPLELAFLPLFEAHGIAVDKQVPVAADEGGRFVSVADFVVRGEKVAIYIDGAAFHRGARLRRDRVIQKALREGSAGWRVVELVPARLGDGAGGIAEVRG